MTKQFLLTVSFVALIGCGGKAIEVRTPQDHPAHPEAAQTAFETPKDVLTEEMTHAEQESAEHHQMAALSEDGQHALAAMLDAYFAMGDQLASDTMDDVNHQAHAMLQAFHTLEHEVPAELWDAHAAHTEKIHDSGHELADLSDIKAARITYGLLSDAFNHFVAAIGVPANYEKPVYSYVCGMAADVPKGGVWMQLGDNVRNPYFGSAMLKCRSEQVQLPVASAEMSGHEHQMKEEGEHEHEHMHEKADADKGEAHKREHENK